MKVQQIIKTALTLINEPDTYNNISSGKLDILTDNDKATYNALISCVNLTNNVLATEYYPLKQTININSSGKLSYSDISSSLAISQILKVEGGFGGVRFKEYPDYIETPKGNFKITFTYLPKTIANINESILCYPTKLTERIFAYGVVSEYYFIMGMYDDAVVWDARFKNSLQTVLKPKHEVKIKNRLWI